MNWVLAIAVGWVLASALLAVLIGAAVRVADRRGRRSAASRLTEPSNVALDPCPSAVGERPAESVVASSGAGGEQVRPRVLNRDPVNQSTIVPQRQAH